MCIWFPSFNKFLGNYAASVKKKFTAFYGLDTEPETEPELVKSRNRNRNK